MTERQDTAETYYTMLRLPTLQLEIMSESGIALPLMIGDDETLDNVLDIAIDGAAYDGNWSGLVLLRECLLKFADEAESALLQIAREGPYKDQGGSA